ncbi:hypothetical protein ACCQ08_06060 [Comamonas sp. SY3]|uniref:hypothetical protein n=2 Tax=unclassified Comamonas TaxID=2638500 RepID=UPI0035948963
MMNSFFQIALNHPIVNSYVMQFLLKSKELKRIHRSCEARSAMLQRETGTDLSPGKPLWMGFSPVYNSLGGSVSGAVPQRQRAQAPKGITFVKLINYYS